jgi:DinB superfamily
MAPDLVSPVDAPEAYRQLLLGLLGEDDPAQVQGGTVARMRDLVRASGGRLRDRPAPDEWSVIECLGHLLDGELVVSTRARWILAEDEPDIVGYDQDRWVDGLHHRDDDPDDLLALFAGLRAANLRLWAATPPDARRRFGVHRERGPESYDLMWNLTAGHDRFHVAQAERALAAVRRN